MQDIKDGVLVVTKAFAIALLLAVAIVTFTAVASATRADAYLSASNAKTFALNKTWYGNRSPSAFCETWTYCRAFPDLAGDSHRMTNGHYWVNVRKYTKSGANCEAGLEVAGNDGSEKLADGFYVWGWIC